MRRVLVPLSFSLASVIGCAGARTDVTADTAALRERTEAVVAAEAAKDTEGSVAFYTDDAIVQVAGAPQIQGREAITALYQEFFEGDQLKHFEAAASHLEVSGDLGLDYGTYRMILAGPDTDLIDDGKYLAVWKRVDGEWLISALSFTSDMPTPVPASVQP